MIKFKAFGQGGLLAKRARKLRHSTSNWEAKGDVL